MYLLWEIRSALSLLLSGFEVYALLGVNLEIGSLWSREIPDYHAGSKSIMLKSQHSTTFIR